jgi:hypothetical protein
MCAGRCGGGTIARRFTERIFSGWFTANGYMPRKDVEALNWVRYFSNGLTDRPAMYRVTADEAAAVAAAYLLFADAYAQVVPLEMRTASAVSAKDAARARAESACRPLYARIKSDPTVADSDKILIGVRPINSARTRIGPPASMPLISLVMVTLDGHMLLVRDAETPSRMRKADGAVQVQLFGAIGDGATSQYIGSYSRPRITIRYPQTANGQSVTYCARWINRRGEVGPWSRPLILPIVAVATRVTNLAA